MLYLDPCHVQRNAAKGVKGMTAVMHSETGFGDFSFGYNSSKLYLLMVQGSLDSIESTNSVARGE